MVEVSGSQITREALWSFDLAELSVRELNQSLHASDVAAAVESSC